MDEFGSACTADPGKADKRTRSKWSRVMTTWVLGDKPHGGGPWSHGDDMCDQGRGRAIVDVSPLFRTAAASTSTIYGGDTPHLASALLQHKDPRVTEEHYNRAISMSAVLDYAGITVRCK
jgi:hypothetical protein